eukprot:SAG25_NODE_66_length_17563_cov_34.737918_17_plen_731_part_00
MGGCSGWIRCKYRSGPHPRAGLNPPVAGRLLYNASLSGSIPAGICAKNVDLHENQFDSAPAMANCTELRTLDLSNNSLAALPSTLPSDLTHLYVNANPLNVTVSALSQSLHGTDLAALDVQFLNVPLFWNYINHGEGCLGSCDGPRVAAPRMCALGPNAPPCQWTIHLYDAWDQPCHVGGMAHNLSLGLGCHDGFDSCTHRADIVDQRDGTFLATVGAGWIPKQGSYAFRFFRQGVEFKPAYASGESYPPSGYDTLRTVQFTPRTDCPQHAEPDVTGLHCSCKTGYEAERTTSNSTLACRRRCENGHVPGLNNTCICPSRSYDPSVVGVLHCAASEWSEPEPAPVSPRCDSCPECATCEDGRTTLKPGWRFANEDFRTAFRCPYAEINDTNATCPSMALPVVVQPPCRGNHTGELCAVCQPRFTRHASSDNRCERCSDASYSEAVFGIPTGWLVVATLAVVLALGALLWFARERIRSAKGLVWTHARILLGWAQVISLLSGVLDIVYPPHARTALSAASLAVADLRGVVRLDCLGWTFQAKWFTLVLGVPGALLLLITGYFVYRHRTQRLAAKAEAVAACFFVAMLLCVPSPLRDSSRCEVVRAQIPAAVVDDLLRAPVPTPGSGDVGARGRLQHRLHRRELPADEGPRVDPGRAGAGGLPAVAAGLARAAVDARNGGPGRPPARDVRLLRRRLPPRLLVLRGTCALPRRPREWLTPAPRSRWTCCGSWR